MDTATSQQTTRFVNRTNPAVIVELIGDAEFRLAEFRSPVIVYRRGDTIYVRRTSEFHEKFKPHDQEN